MVSARIFPCLIAVAGALVLQVSNSRRHACNNAHLCYVPASCAVLHDDLYTSFRVAAQAGFAIGERVRVRADVAMPRHKWGNVRRGDIGTIARLEGDGSSKCYIDFQRQSGWIGDTTELERAPADAAAAAPITVRTAAWQIPSFGAICMQLACSRTSQYVHGNSVADSSFDVLVRTCLRQWCYSVTCRLS